MLVAHFSRSLYFSGQYQKALNFYQRIEDTLYYKNRLDCYENLKMYDRAISLSLQIKDQHLRLWYASYYLHLKNDYAGEQKNLGLLHENSSFRKKDVEDILDQLNSPLKRKHYSLGFIASIIPGGGYFYTQRYGDALYTYMLMIPLAVVSGVYYYSGAKVRAYTFGGLAGVFYMGSIYGGLVGVKLYNRKIETNKFNSIKRFYTRQYE